MRVGRRSELADFTHRRLSLSRPYIPDGNIRLAMLEYRITILADQFQLDVRMLPGESRQVAGQEAGHESLDHR